VIGLVTSQYRILTLPGAFQTFSGCTCFFNLHPKRGAFFNVEALPEGTILAFPIALRKTFGEKPITVKEFLDVGVFTESRDMYFGGLESVGFGRTIVTVKESAKVSK
jgi:hypothetical protein